MVPSNAPLRSIVLTTNKAFAEWPTTFPNAARVVALVDRLINRAEIVVIDGDSYRLHEAEERQRARVTARKSSTGRALDGRAVGPSRSVRRTATAWIGLGCSKNSGPLSLMECLARLKGAGPEFADEKDIILTAQPAIPIS